MSTIYGLIFIHWWSRFMFVNHMYPFSEVNCQMWRRGLVWHCGSMYVQFGLDRTFFLTIQECPHLYSPLSPCCFPSLCFLWEVWESLTEDSTGVGTCHFWSDRSLIGIRLGPRTKLTTYDKKTGYVLHAFTQQCQIMMFFSVQPVILNRNHVRRRFWSLPWLVTLSTWYFLKPEVCFPVPTVFLTFKTWMTCSPVSARPGPKQQLLFC